LTRRDQDHFGPNRLAAKAKRRQRLHAIGGHPRRADGWMAARSAPPLLPKLRIYVLSLARPSPWPILPRNHSAVHVRPERNTTKYAPYTLVAARSQELFGLLVKRMQSTDLEAPRSNAE
jgi:hypothetical protein